MTVTAELKGECHEIRFKLYRERAGKYSVLAELLFEGRLVDSQQITEARTLTYAIQELADAAYSLEIALNRNKISLIAK